MDTLSHALVGLAVAGLSGHAPTIYDPIYIATILGAQAPDLDIAFRVRGNMAYLRQHRAASHSFPGIVGWSLAITLLIRLLLPQATVWQTFVWALAGSLSHIILDYFNTHGVAILWPIKKDRKSYPLLNVFDPLLIAAMLAQYLLPLPVAGKSRTIVAGIACYILLRYLLRRQAVSRLKKRFTGTTITRMWLMPSLTRLFFWDFVIETSGRCLNGRLGALHPVLEIRADLPKQPRTPLTIQAQGTDLGEFFRTFTPFSYFEESPDQSPRVNIYDLRYFTDQHFIHSGTVLFDCADTPAEIYTGTSENRAKLRPAEAN